MIKKLLYIISRNTELLFWSVAFVLLFFMNPVSESFSFCLVKMMGFSWCPGCGIGHSIHYALHLNFEASVHEHFFGIPAVLIILQRIYHLLNKVSHVRNQFFYQPDSGH